MVVCSSLRIEKKQGVKIVYVDLNLDLKIFLQVKRIFLISKEKARYLKSVKLKNFARHSSTDNTTKRPSTLFVRTLDAFMAWKQTSSGNRYELFLRQSKEFNG